MSEQPANPGTAPLPSMNEVTGFLKILQSSLGAYVQCDSRGDESGKATASARVIGAYRKIVSTYESLPADSQADLAEPVMALHETIVSLGIPLGPSKTATPS